MSQVLNLDAYISDDDGSIDEASGAADRNALRAGQSAGATYGNVVKGDESDRPSSSSGTDVGGGAIQKLAGRSTHILTTPLCRNTGSDRKESSRLVGRPEGAVSSQIELDGQALDRNIRILARATTGCRAVVVACHEEETTH